MITERVQALFNFIDFLHSNMGYLLSKQPLIDEVNALFEKRSSLNPNENYKRRIEYDMVQKDLVNKFDTVENETTKLIKDKIKECDIADISTPIINLNALADLFDLQKKFDVNDLVAIFEAKRKYLEFRTKTNFHYFLEIFFHKLDNDLKGFFNYFKDNTENEFEAFETKTIQVNNIIDVVEQFQKGHKRVSLPFDFLNPSKVQQNNNEAFTLQQTEKATGKEISPPSNELNQSYWIADDFFKNNDWLKSYFKKSLPFDNRIPQIEVNGKRYKIYVPELFVILTNKNVPFENNEGMGTFNGWDFMKDYKTGFEKGETYFNTEFALPANILYNNPKPYLENLHLCYYHKAPNENCGWIKWIETYPMFVTSSEIEQYGFYAGLKYALDQLKERHPVIFKNFDVCPENNLQAETKTEQEQPKTFEKLFYNPEHAEICLSIFRTLQPPVIDALNNYIGRAKGVFPLWVRALKNHKPEPLIKHFADTVYKDLLNEKIKGLNLSKDASEFRKKYKRLENDKTELDIKAILSQYSQSGKLGK